MGTPVYITQIQALILHYMSLINNTRQFRINTLLVDDIYITHKRTCKLFHTYPTLRFNMIHPHSTQIFEWIYTTQIILFGNFPVEWKSGEPHQKDQQNRGKQRRSEGACYMFTVLVKNRANLSPLHMFISLVSDICNTPGSARGWSHQTQYQLHM